MSRKGTQGVASAGQSRATRTGSVGRKGTQGDGSFAGLRFVENRVFPFVSSLVHVLCWRRARRSVLPPSALAPRAGVSCPAEVAAEACVALEPRLLSHGVVGTARRAT